MKVYQTMPYVYKWTHLPTLKWYVGSRTSKNSHPDDGYICSSKIVKEEILKYPTEWRRDIVAIGTKNEMTELEGVILTTLNARDDLRSFNKHNNDGNFKFVGGVPNSKRHNEKISTALKGIIRSEEYKKKMSSVKKGKPNHKLSIATKGVPKPNVSKAKKGKPQPKAVCRLKDKKEMALSHFNRWCNREDNPEILLSIFAKTRGKEKKKTVCRLIDKKELSLGHYLRWLSTVTDHLSS